MGTITTAVLNSFKRDVLSGLHCFNATVTPTGTTSNGSPIVTSVSALTGLAVGMSVSGTGIASGSVIASIDSSTQITLSKNATASNAGVTLTCAGDIFNIALIKASPTGSYSASTTNYTDVTGNSDEVSGAGYTAGGTALTNVSPTISGSTAFVDFTPDPSWTSATFTTDGAMVYNTRRRGPTATLACSVHAFGSTQTVSGGTFTVVMPAADSSNAIIRIA